MAFSMFAFGLNPLIFAKIVSYGLTSKIVSYCNWAISYRIELILLFQAMKTIEAMKHCLNKK